MDIPNVVFRLSLIESLGIIQLIESCQPKNVMLVHGKQDKMMSLRSEIKEKLQVKCYAAVTGETCIIETLIKIPTEAEISLLKKSSNKCSSRGPRPTPAKRSNNFTVHVAEENRIIMLNVSDVCKEDCMGPENARFYAKLKFSDPDSKSKTIDKLFSIFKEKLTGWSVKLVENSAITVESVEMRLVPDANEPLQQCISVSWSNRDEDIAGFILEVLCSFS